MATPRRSSLQSLMGDLFPQNACDNLKKKKLCIKTSGCEWDDQGESCAAAYVNSAKSKTFTTDHAQASQKSGGPAVKMPASLVVGLVMATFVYWNYI